MDDTSFDTNLMSRIRLSCGSIILSLLGLAHLWNLYSHNVRYETPYGTTIEKSDDGLYNYTAINIRRDGSVRVVREHGTNWRSYSDRNEDGFVDSIIKHKRPFARGPSALILERKNDLGKYSSDFQEADEDFRQQMIRFKLSIERKR